MLHSATERRLVDEIDEVRSRLARYEFLLFEIHGRGCDRKTVLREEKNCRQVRPAERGAWCPACLIAKALPREDD